MQCEVLVAILSELRDQNATLPLSVTCGIYHCLPFSTTYSGRDSTKIAEISFETIHTWLINLTESIVVARSRASVEHDLPKYPKLQRVFHEAGLLPPFPSRILVARQWRGRSKIFSSLINSRSVQILLQLRIVFNTAES